MIQRNEITGAVVEWLFHFRDVDTGKQWTEGPYNNKVVQGGLENLASLLIGEVTSDTAVTHVVLGDSAVAAAINDDITAMGEVIRKDITSKTRSGAMARFRTFFQTAEANGDFACVGLVARGTNVPGSGVLLNRLVQPFSKASNTVMTVEVRWIHQGVI